jgi:hypothetical protein
MFLLFVHKMTERRVYSPEDNAKMKAFAASINYDPTGTNLIALQKWCEINNYPASTLVQKIYKWRRSMVGDLESSGDDEDGSKDYQPKRQVKNSQRVVITRSQSKANSKPVIPKNFARKTGELVTKSVPPTPINTMSSVTSPPAMMKEDSSSMNAIPMMGSPPAMMKEKENSSSASASASSSSSSSEAKPINRKRKMLIEADADDPSVENTIFFQGVRDIYQKRLRLNEAKLENIRQQKAQLEALEISETQVVNTTKEQLEQLNLWLQEREQERKQALS